MGFKFLDPLKLEESNASLKNCVCVFIMAPSLLRFCRQTTWANVFRSTQEDKIGTLNFFHLIDFTFQEYKGFFCLGHSLPKILGPGYTYKEEWALFLKTMGLGEVFVRLIPNTTLNTRLWPRSFPAEKHSLDAAEQET